MFLRRDRLPTPAEWQASLTAAGFAVELDLDFDPVAHDGFLPASYEGREAGFEYLFSDVADDDYDESIPPRLGERDAVVSLITHSNMTELMTSTLAAAALAVFSDGLVYDTEAGALYAADEALAWARGLEAEILPDL